MPFPQQNRLSFNQVGTLNPNQTGCYGIFRADGTPIYVGKGDLRARLMAHLNGDNPCIMRGQPSYVLTALANPPDEMEKHLIIEYQPICNQRVG